MIRPAFDEATHTYYVSGRRVPSVTQILSDLGIRPNFPAGHINKDLGVAVHLAVHLDTLGELEEADTDELVMSYVRLWREFLGETGATVLESEQRLAYIKAPQYAGTVDQVLLWPDGEYGVCDMKITEYGPPTGTDLQVAAYGLILREERREGFTGTFKRGSLQIHKNAYRYHPFTDSTPYDTEEHMFLQCAAVWYRRAA